MKSRNLNEPLSRRGTGQPEVAREIVRRKLSRQHEPDDPVRLPPACGPVMARQEEGAVWCPTCGVISGSDARRGIFRAHHLVHPRADITDLGMPDRKVSGWRKGCSLVTGETFQFESGTGN